MNEEAIQDSYDVFVSQGYTKSIDEYKKLISSNPDALNDSYKAFVGQGYGKSINDYKALMGIGQQPIAAQVKKKILGHQTFQLLNQVQLHYLRQMVNWLRHYLLKQNLLLFKTH
jgi:hypothetical protein